MNRFFTVFSGCIISLSIVSCTGETADYTIPAPTKPEVPETPNNPDPEEIPDITIPAIASAPLSTVTRETVGSFNDFSLKFYLANSKNSNNNVCVSPFGVGSVLGMIANGDDGAARNGILNVLGFEESDKGLATLNTFYQTLLSNLPNIEEDVSCNVTNTLWLDPSNYIVRKTFLQTIEDYYYAYRIGIDPSGERGKDKINNFVSKYTNDLITNFLHEPLMINLAFLNTIYFKGGWSCGFEKGMTGEGTFFDIDYHEQKTDFMFRCSMTRYARTNDGTEAIRLNYGHEEQFSMTFILPSSDINHPALGEILTTDNIEQINRNLKDEYMIVGLPKFEVEMNNPKSIAILQELGLNDTSATFDMITESNIFRLICFIHATKLKVDEEGTEGAAVSLGGMDEPIGPGSEANNIREIIFNRPFIFYIQENTTGAILFIGSVKTFL